MANIQVQGTRTLKMLFSGDKDLFEELFTEEKVLDLTYQAFFKEDDFKKYIIIFFLKLDTFKTEIDTPFQLVIDFMVEFSIDEEITKEFKESNFVKINSPAIGYPYLRACISNLLINNGYNSVHLPSINFVGSHEKIFKGVVDILDE